MDKLHPPLKKSFFITRNNLSLQRVFMTRINPPFYFLLNQSFKMQKVFFSERYFLGITQCLIYLKYEKIISCVTSVMRGSASSHQVV